ncbi:hypothetical protein MARCHEWKA_03140 [Brevundimonas phage vB_BpoS-Marchewka]|uniref:Uncharacterized protein n=1 Tax=Brevundimonas phage vB_BpoS-Marchewka TaxID=2948604 RepID=A0A9E7N2T1_9CAUD|nr:hypothetical protein MARCHEWKA_03140 [Brevundimonas phage vB_BpoS-Marchewka]UTC29273.1 hypothetical protein BAMBUS_01910 [Brevundimonas phage vB_BpoS-Bambus]
MFERTLAYHREQIRQHQAVLDTDGNLYSDHHRTVARQALVEHRDIVDELTRPIDGVRAGKALAVLNALLIDDRHESKRLDRLSEGTEKGSFSREEMAREIRMRDERAEAVQTALVLLTEAAERPTLRHKKRGTTYAVHAVGMLQTEHPLSDGAALTIYRDENDGAWFLRPPAEMEDGRFASVGELPGVETPDGHAVTLIFSDMDDVSLTLTQAEIDLAETHATLSLDWDRTDNEDLWGDYVVREVLYDGGRVSSLGLRRL